jgi:hypothetical protein
VEVEIFSETLVQIRKTNYNIPHPTQKLKSLHNSNCRLVKYSIFVKRWRYSWSVIFFHWYFIPLCPEEYKTKRNGQTKPCISTSAFGSTSLRPLETSAGLEWNLTVGFCLWLCRVTICSLLSKYCVRMWSHDVFKRWQVFRHPISRILLVQGRVKTKFLLTPCVLTLAQWLLYTPPALTYQNFTFCTTRCICVFGMVLTINSDCFPKQH